MLELKQNLYWELEFTELEKLVQEHFSFAHVFDYTYIVNGTYYVTSLDMNKDDQIVDSELIEELLISDEYSCERIDNAIWLLIMKDVLPQGNYLISICW